MDVPLISIVTVTFNCAEALQTTIDSVAGQTYQHVEHIVIDGNSSDGTVQVIRENEGELTRWISEPDDGIYDAMNKGLALTDVNSRFTCFLNAGDTFYDCTTLADVARLGRHPHGHFYGNVQKGSRSINTPRKLTPFRLATRPLCHQAVFFDTRLHREIPYDTSYRISADYKLLLSMVSAGHEFTKVERPVVRFDTTGVSQTDRPSLHSEKRRIRAEFPRVRFLYWLKTSLRKFTPSGTQST